MAKIFTPSAKLTAAVKLINNTEIDKFSKIVSRVSENIHDRTKTTFNVEEKLKLSQVLGLNEDSLKLILDTIEFIFQQSAYHSLKPMNLKENLTELNLLEDKSEVIILVWQSNGRDIVQKLRGNSIAPKQLREISWDLNLKLAQSSKANLKESNTNLQLGIVNNKDEQIENVLLEFNHEQLFEFYKKLEMIQNQLDKLS